MADTTNTTKDFDNADAACECGNAAEGFHADAGNADNAAESAVSVNADAGSSAPEGTGTGADGATEASKGDTCQDKAKPSLREIQAQVRKEFGLGNLNSYSQIHDASSLTIIESIMFVERKIENLKKAILSLDPAAYDFSAFMPTAREFDGFDLDKHHVYATLKPFTKIKLQKSLVDLQNYALNLGGVLVQLRVADANGLVVTVQDLVMQMQLSHETVESTLVNIPGKPHIPEELKTGNLEAPEKPVMPELPSLSESDRKALEEFLGKLDVYYSEADKAFGAVTKLQDLTDKLSESWDTLADKVENLSMQNIALKAKYDSSSEQSRYVNGGTQADGDSTKGSSPEGKKEDDKNGGSGKDKKSQDSDGSAPKGAGAGNGSTPKTGYGTHGGNKKSKGCSARRTANLRSVSIVHGEMTDEELMEFFHITDPAELAKVRKFVCNPTKEVIVIPAVEVTVIHGFAKYKYNGEWSGGGSAGSFKLLNGHECSVDMMAHILDMSTFKHMPYYRTHKEMVSWQYNIGKDAIPRWVRDVSFQYLEVFYRMLIKKVLACSHINVDETFFKVVHDGRGRGTQSYIWIVSRGELLKDLPPMVVYFYDETRSTDVLRYNLGDYCGVISCDGFGDYTLFEKERINANLPLTISCCWTHVRRKFAALCRMFHSYCKDKAKRKKNPYCWCFDQCNKIIHEDAKLSGLSPEERLAKRQEVILPLVDEFFAYIKKYKDARGEFGKAVNYALNLERQLRVFLNDPLAPATNSHAERSALFFALSRNAFRQIDSIDGAQATAIIHSIAATADANGVNGFLYFKYLLERLPEMLEKHGMPVGGKAYDYSYLEVLLPWGEDYKAYEKRMLGLYGDAGKAYATALYESLGYTVEKAS